MQSFCFLCKRWDEGGFHHLNPKGPLIFLCRKCHDKLHQEEREFYRRVGLYPVIRKPHPKREGRRVRKRKVEGV